MRYIYTLIFVIGFSALSFFAGRQYSVFVPNKAESQEANDLQEYATYLIGGGTLVVLFAQCVIFARQEAAMRRTAQIAEDSMTVAKWAYLYIKSPEFITPMGKRASVPPVFEYWMVVFGESHAVITHLYEKLYFTPGVPSFTKPDAIEWETPDRFIKQKEGWERQVVVERLGENFKWTAELTKDWRYYYRGHIIYDDVFGNQHELAFCYSASQEGGAGVKFGGSKLNYHKRRSEDDRI